MDYTIQLNTGEERRQKIEEYIRENLKESRLQHTYRVAEEARKLAERFAKDLDMEKVETAALLHDSAKYVPREQMNELIRKLELDPHYIDNSNLAHSKLGAWVAREKFGITDMDILNAISYHTTGREDMSLLEKIIFLADAIEPGRKYTGVDDIRRLVWEEGSLNKACLRSLENTIHFVKTKGDYLDPDTEKACQWLRKTESI